ncbi:Uncharacterised protein [Citrobacter werkmanii]|uniref:Uncharacterized protein n=1 Tax=Citrobacter werkmanii TaxID=67827 RepID=A0A9N8GWN5_9ENTR|nr:Uncharacterised protein [Citrobacter werkmanii]
MLANSTSDSMISEVVLVGMREAPYCSAHEPMATSTAMPTAQAIQPGAGAGMPGNWPPR